ncbi:hypothetical protein ABLE91_26910 [Aquabacter sp. CN5-332]|uniref:hypothetical protein n=1 Tax=Aquabacter sp. CN5-332 TaxID=3156608 RepID=UPI0032B5DFB4
MAEGISNKDPARAAAQRSEPDAHGQAALLLVESLIHALIARALISAEDAVEIVGVATEVKAEIGADLGDSPATMEKSLTLLKSISASLMHDVAR